jgi:hypothetical protein
VGTRKLCFSWILEGKNGFIVKIETEKLWFFRSLTAWERGTLSMGTRKVLNYRTPYEVFFEEFAKEVAA